MYLHQASTSKSHWPIGSFKIVSVFIISVPKNLQQFQNVLKSKLLRKQLAMYKGKNVNYAYTLKLNWTLCNVFISRCIIAIAMKIVMTPPPPSWYSYGSLKCVQNFIKILMPCSYTFYYEKPKSVISLKRLHHNKTENIYTL